MTTLLFGLVPALVSAGASAAEALKDGTRSSTGVRGRRISRALVVAEVALACAVLVASALLVRSVVRMMRAPTGIIADNVVTTTIQLSGAAYQDWNKVEQFYTTLLESARRQPGIEAVGASTIAGARSLAGGIPTASKDVQPRAPDEAMIAQHISVSTGYFETMRRELLQGRYFQDTDSPAGEPVDRRQPDASHGGRSRAKTPSASASSPPLSRSGRSAGTCPGLVPFRIVGVIADMQQAPIGQTRRAGHLPHAAAVPVQGDDDRRPRARHGGRRDRPAGCRAWPRRLAGRSAPCGRWMNASWPPRPARAC